MPEASYAELTDAERRFVQDHLDAVPLFINSYSPSDSGLPVSLAILDRAFAAWLKQDVQDNAQINGTIKIVGVRFGQFLVDEVGFRWTVATDRQGTELAVLALPGHGDVLVFPANFVAKRWERRESDFMVWAFDAIRKQVHQVQATNERQHRPWWKVW